MKDDHGRGLRRLILGLTLALPLAVPAAAGADGKSSESPPKTAGSPERKSPAPGGKAEPSDAPKPDMEPCPKPPGAVEAMLMALGVIPPNPPGDHCNDPPPGGG